MKRFPCLTENSDPGLMLPPACPGTWVSVRTAPGESPLGFLSFSAPGAVIPPLHAGPERGLGREPVSWTFKDQPAACQQPDGGAGAGGAGGAPVLSGLRRRGRRRGAERARHPRRPGCESRRPGTAAG